MHPTATPPLADEAADAVGPRWWVPGLVWWVLTLGVLVWAVQEFS
jgi:hypothetical protein